MNLYAFELGRKKDLCFAELIAVLGEENLMERNLDTAIFELEDFEAQKLQDRLGGSIKTIQIIAPTDQKQLRKQIENELESDFKDRSGKIPFSVSALSYKNQQDINIKQILNFSKIFLKSLGLNSRFVNKNFQNTRPSTIYKAKVVKKGIDINIIKGKHHMWLGKTIAIQNIDAYSKRDYDKPARDTQVGMTPPKLAQIMINLAGESQTIYDPFCGTGTYLMEAMLMGKTAIGSDLAARMVEMAEKNCDWLAVEFHNNSKYRIFESDAHFISKKTVPEKIDTIVTEGYLGPAVSKTPAPEQREKTFRELANLHLNWLKAAHNILPTGGKIVMCIAAFRTKQGIEHLPHFEQLAETAGYEVEALLQYERHEQVVIRNIAILVKK